MTTADEADKKARLERARATGLFRYSLVQELTDPGLSLAERGWRAREMAGARPRGAGRAAGQVSRKTLTRWRRCYEEGGFDALVPSPRQPAPRTPAEVLALAAALKREKPGRTARAGAADLAGHVGVGAVGPDAAAAVRAAGAEPAPRADRRTQQVFGRFEASGRTRCGPATLFTGP